ncbi:MAG: sugar ABC transporter ATP-binding protein [Candidatus Hydrogenedentes bacterium]|nr:sugar ABC transporter ATP-binding protein [Candidatus Hydrogenedentota bacterium]
MQENAHVLVETRGVSKSFGPQTVLSGVDFTLRAGEVHLLAGENGAGKSTLIKILAGVYQDYKGTVLLQGAPVRFASPRAAADAGIAVIHQELSLIPAMSVSDNIFLGRERTRLGQVQFGEQAGHCRDLLLRLGLNVDPGVPAGNYPISIQQGIEIAKALAFESRILIMDEPTSSLNQEEVDRLFEVIAGLRAAGCGIIYISHKMEEIYRIADRITVLRDGALAGTAPAGELPQEKLIRWMVGRELAAQAEVKDVRQDGIGIEVEQFTVQDPRGLPRPAVDAVSFQVRRGEVVGLGGLQGSGASELLNGLFGVYGRRATGSVRVAGAAYAPATPRHAIESGLALVTNDRKTTGLVGGMSIARNATLAAFPRYTPWGLVRESQETAAAEAYRTQLNIKCADVSMPVNSLSGGNQQKVVLAKWLDINPCVLLLDEPTRGVDVGAKQEIYGLIRQWTAQGKAVLLVTTEMSELLSLSDRILVMHRGQITAEFARHEATQEKVLAAAMGQSAAGCEAV